MKFVSIVHMQANGKRIDEQDDPEWDKKVAR